MVSDSPRIPASTGLTYYRRFTLHPQPGRLEAHMQDYYHHLRVVLEHSGGTLTRASGEGIRLPWNACPLAAAGINRLTGMTVAAALDPSNWPGGRTANCVHASDLTLVALAHIEDEERFTYDIDVTPASGRVRTARCARNGSPFLEWTVEGTTLTSPAHLAGRTLAKPDFLAWTADLDPAMREAATVLRRGCHIAPSRDFDLDTMRVASDSIRPDSSCYVLQPSVIDTARRVVGSARAVLTDADGR